MEKHTLAVGDIVVYMDSWTSTIKQEHTVNRVTAKFAFTDTGLKIHRTASSTSFKKTRFSQSGSAEALYLKDENLLDQLRQEAIRRECQSNHNKFAKEDPAILAQNGNFEKIVALFNEQERQKLLMAVKQAIVQKVAEQEGGNETIKQIVQIIQA